VHAATLQLWLCRLQLRMALPKTAARESGAAGDGLEDSALLQGLLAGSSAEEAVCTQVVTSLQNAVKHLDAEDAAERAVQCEGQNLLGSVLLRQGLVRLARAVPFCAACQLCSDGDGAMSGAVELIQAAEQSGIDVVRESAELLQQASSHFKEACNAVLNGTAHACLAAIYFCGRRDARVQRLAMMHCQHALEQLHALAGADVDCVARTPLCLAVQLLEAKMMRRPGGKGSTHSQACDAKLAVVLCDVAQHCQRPGGADDDPVRLALLAGDERGLHLMTYVKQDLNDVMLRLLRSSERQEGIGREMKELYCSLLSAWHTEVGQADALVALRNRALRLAQATAPSTSTDGG